MGHLTEGLLTFHNLMGDIGINDESTKQNKKHMNHMQYEYNMGGMITTCMEYAGASVATAIASPLRSVRRNQIFVFSKMINT